MASVIQSRTGDVRAFLRVTKTATAPDPQVHQKRAMIAQWCRLIATQLGQDMPVKFPVNLSPRLKQTLQLLLVGHSEKEVAAKMGISIHTVHVHVKTLHKRFGVSSRGELLSKIFNKNGSTPPAPAVPRPVVSLPRTPRARKTETISRQKK